MIVRSWISSVRPPASQHCRLEVLAAVAAGHRSGELPPLEPGQPVAGCICETCTRLDDRHVTAPRSRALEVDNARAVPVLEITDLLGLGKPRRRGREYTVRCPLHEDNRPSLRISPEKGVWYCDVCAEGGDGIRLWERVRNTSFGDAVREITTGIGLNNERYAKRARTDSG